MSLLQNVASVFRFEWKRSLTFSRGLWWLVLALFPAGISLLFRLSSYDSPIFAVAQAMMALCPMVVCMLGVFLWSTPAISAELERQSWVYLAVRPHGRTSVVLGKYFTSVTWTIPAAIIGLALALQLIPIAEVTGGQISPNQQQTLDNLFKNGMPELTRMSLFLGLAPLCVVSSMSYAAIYTFIGTVFIRRSMVVAVAYTVIFEVVVALIPAIVNQFTIHYRLQLLFESWVGIPVVWRIQSMAAAANSSSFEAGSAWQQLLILAAEICGLLFLSALLLNRRELTANSTED